MVICIYLEQGADLHMAQLMLLPLTVSCFSKIQIGLNLSGAGVCVCVSAKNDSKSVGFDSLQPSDCTMTEHVSLLLSV